MVRRHPLRASRRKAGRPAAICFHQRVMKEEPQFRGPRSLRIHQSPLERARLWVEIFAFIAAGCWALYTFVYETKLAPGFLPAHEVISADVHRVAENPSNYFERVNITIENDGSVGVDTAGLAVTLWGLKPSSSAQVQSQTSAFDDLYRNSPPSAWRPLQSHGLLFDGAVTGKRGRHYILNPGDKTSFQELAIVPRNYRVLRVDIETVYGRYPINPRVDVRLLNQDGAISLRSSYISIAFATYFGV